MVFGKYDKLIQELYKISNPIIKYRIDKDLYGKDNITIDQYTSFKDNTIDCWLNSHKSNQIHGRMDYAYENSIAKLLDFGLTKDNQEFQELYSYLLQDEYWQEDNSFEGILMKTVKYPFLIRAGYLDNKNVNNFFIDRLEMIEKTIEKYGYEFEDLSRNVPKKYMDEFIFKMNCKYESLPTIYDLYAFTYYPKDNDDITRRIEEIVKYLLDKQYQRIPSKAYIFDSTKKRYYATGSVYHACMIEERKLLMVYMLSHFKAASESPLFMNEIKEMMSYVSDDGFFEFDKSLMKEKKDSYYIYSGSHMGLGENRTNRNWRKIESTFWMLKILLNLESNNIIV